MLAPFIAPILAAIKWLAITALPLMASTFVVGILIKIGIAVTSWVVIVWTAEYLRDMAIAQIAVIQSGTIGGAVVSMLSLFGVFEGLSLIVSCYLAKATWLAISPSLTWINPQ
jgi:hypothetical protein